MKITKMLMIIIFLCVVTTHVLAAIAGKISGVVTDEKGHPIVGANIIVVGTHSGAASDLQGFYYILNVPVGKYVLKATSIGYTPLIIENVYVGADLTTKVNFKLQETVLEMQEVVIQEYKAPAVQKDLTFKVQTMNIDEMRVVPITDMKQLVEKQAGVTKHINTTPVASRPVFGQFSTVPSDGLHFRGGRENETLYLFDGINVDDGLWGGFKLETLGEFSFKSFETLSGTFGPQYGERMSGVVNIGTLDNPVSDYSLYLRGYSDNLGVESSSENTYNGEFQFTGPLPFVKNLTLTAAVREYTSDGYIYGYLYPNYIDSEGKDKSGTPEKVPMQFWDSRYIMSKLIWQPHPNFKMVLGGFSTKANQGVYNHYFKYNPYGTPRVYLDDVLGYLKINHVISPSTFYTVTFSQYARNFESYVFNNSEENLVRPQTGSAEFSISGEDWVFFDSEFIRNEVRAEMTSQITKLHKLELGTVFDFLTTKLDRRNPDGFEYIEHYDIRPRKYAGFIFDKMEFEDMGMIVSAGLRYDFVDPNRVYIKNIFDPEGAVEEVPTRSYISPRLGISYPVSDVAAFHFGYGHYYQYPDFYKVFQGMNSDYPLYPRPNVRTVSGAIATGDIEEEKTINYEAGIQVKVSDEISFNTTGFYRKTSNLVGMKIVEDINGVKFPAFDNLNFATVKGLEFSLKKRFSNYFSGFLNYTYSKTLVSSSLIFQVPTDISRTFPADWDQPHVLNFNLAFKFPAEWGFSVSGGASSGLPYTFNQLQPNAERAPWIHALDLLLYKDFAFLKFNQRIFVQVLNVPNRRNVWWVYADSGKPGIDANPATSDDYTNNPSMWGPGRRVQLGASFWF